MRILHTLETFKRNGGIGTYLAGVIEAQSDQGHDVRVLARSTDSSAREWHESEGFEPEIVHAHDYWRPPHAFAAPLTQSLHNYDFGCSTYTRYLGGGEPCERPHGAGCVGNWLRCGHSPRLGHFMRNYAATTGRLGLVQRASRVIVYSQFMRAVAERNGILKDRIDTIPCPVPRFDSDTRYSAAIPGLVSYFGRLSKPKGVDVAIAAIARVPGARLRVIGDGYMRGELEHLAGNLAPGRVEFVGWAAPEALSSHYSASSAVIMPGRWPEPFGLVGLEAAWAARPVLASLSGGVVDWLRVEETGLGVKPGDVEELARAVARTINQPAEAERWGLNARELAENWPTDDLHAESLELAYLQAIARPTT